MIRDYEARDAAAVSGIYYRAAVLAHPFISDGFHRRFSRELPEKWIPRGTTYVAEAGGQVVGFISMLGNEVAGLFVDPVRQGRGIGRRLMEHARARHGPLTVEVFALNPRSLLFYQAMGMEIMEQGTVPAGIDDDVTGLAVFRLADAVSAAADQRRSLP